MVTNIYSVGVSVYVCGRNALLVASHDICKVELCRLPPLLRHDMLLQQLASHGRHGTGSPQPHSNDNDNDNDNDNNKKYLVTNNNIKKYIYIYIYIYITRAI